MAHPRRLTTLLSATGYVFMQNPLPLEHTATCLVNFGSCRSKRNIVVEIKARNQISVWGIGQTANVGLQAGTSAPNTTRATTLRPGDSELYKEIKANLWKPKPICLQKEPHLSVTSRTPELSDALGEGGDNWRIRLWHLSCHFHVAIINPVGWIYICQLALWRWRGGILSGILELGTQIQLQRSKQAFGLCSL